MADSVLTFLDGYCERAGDPAMFAEPVNFISNLCFIVAAVMVGRVLLRSHDKTIDLWLLVAALFSIGIGSGLWHLYPTQTTMLADVIPIALFINIFLIAGLRRLFGLSWRRTLCWWGLFQMLSVAAQTVLPPQLLHGSVMYLPTYAALVALIFGLAKRDRETAKIFMLVTTVWSLSLIFRTVDLEVCAAIPLGTHFLWHTLNAWVLWRLLMVLVGKRAPLR